jgi:DNA-binding GntR family transcriptional regulator
MKPTVSASITQAAYERLRVDLLNGTLPPGQKLKMSGLCETMGINLSAMREALARLAAEGLVVAEPQKGFRAAPLAADDFRDLMETRILVESACLRHAIAAGDLSWESGLVASAHRLFHIPATTEGNPHLRAEWRDAHGAFHAALSAACPNTWLLRLRDMLFVQSERYRGLTLHLSLQDRDVGAEHGAIMAATLDRDTDAAIALLADHLHRTATILLGEAP